MGRFGSTDAGYLALQMVIQDVWAALDEGHAGRDVFRHTTWRTAEIDVPSWTGWDIATSLDLPPGESSEAGYSDAGSSDGGSSMMEEEAL